MLDQHLVIHFTGTSSQEISPPPLDMPTPFLSPHFFSFLLHLSRLSLPSLLANISGNISSPSGLSFHHTQLCPSLLYLYIGPHPSLPPLALGWLWCTLLTMHLSVPGDEHASAEFKSSGFCQFQTLMRSTELNVMDLSQQLIQFI